ncbi:MAG: TIGR03790 family protein [Acidobacteriota bacterium]
MGSIRNMRAKAGGLLLLLAAAAQATDASRILLVRNDDSALSRRLANFYQQWHNLKPDQVCGISVTEQETVSWSVFETQIAAPIRDCLARSRRVESPSYVVLTQGTPIRIQAAAKSDGASVDSELTLLYGQMRGSRHERAGWIANPFYRQKDQSFGHPRFPIYLVTRLAGYSFEDARTAVERCRGARNRGKVVLDLKADNDEEGNSWLRDAAIFLPADRVVLDVTARVLSGLGDVIGYASWGSNDPARKSRKSGLRWLPGAIATEFVSTNARTFRNPPYSWTLGDWKNPGSFFAGSPQSMMLDSVWEGASGVSGHVDEPYLTASTRPDVLFPAYLNGRNLAESYYLALPALSWQTIVVGDPLCRLE